MVGSAECGVGSAECVESSPVRQLRTPHAALRIGSMSLLDRVRALLGSDALLESAGPDGVPRVAPDSPDAVALLLGTAREEGWRVRIEGAGTWMPSDAPCDLALTTRRLDRVPAIEPQDLSATAEAGIGFDLLRHPLADPGVLLAIDPPGLGGRSVGSVIPTPPTGPPRQGVGPRRDPPLGVPLVTGDRPPVQNGRGGVEERARQDPAQPAGGGGRDPCAGCAPGTR